MSQAQPAIAWFPRGGAVSSAITGATKPGQLESNLKAVEVALMDDAIAAIDAIFDPADDVIK